MNLRAVVCSLVAVMVLIGATSACAVETVAVAASIHACVSHMAGLYEAQGHEASQFVIGASGKLAAQIKAGAPFGLFMSANRRWAESLRDEGFLDDLHPMASSPVVSWWPRDEKAPVGESLETYTVAVADTEAAPFGKAAKAYLSDLGLFDPMLADGRIIIAGSVLQTALAADNGGADLAIVSLSIATKMAKGQYEILPVPPLENAGGLVVAHAGPVCRGFWEFIRSEAMDSVWRKWGFEPVPR